MKIIATTLCFFLTFSLFLFQGPASATKAPIKEVIINTNLRGFFDAQGRPLKTISFERYTRVRIIFRYDETIWDSYRTGNLHQFAIVSKESGFRLESKEISYWNKEEVLEFTVGNDGSDDYRIICIVDCVGMDLLGYTIPLTLTII